MLAIIMRDSRQHVRVGTGGVCTVGGGHTDFSFLLESECENV